MQFVLGISMGGVGEGGGLGGRSNGRVAKKELYVFGGGRGGGGMCVCVCWKSGGGVAVSFFPRACRMVLISSLMEMVWDLAATLYLCTADKVVLRTRISVQLLIYYSPTL